MRARAGGPASPRNPLTFRQLQAGEPVCKPLFAWLFPAFIRVAGLGMGTDAHLALERIEETLQGVFNYYAQARGRASRSLTGAVLPAVP